MRKQNLFEIFLLVFALAFSLAVGIAFLVRPSADVPRETYPAVITDPLTDDAFVTVTTEPVATAPAETTEVITDPAETSVPVTEPHVTEPPATEPPVTEPPVIEDKVISVLACGDNLLYRPNTYEADELAVDGKRSYLFTYENVRSMIESADISFINQETLLCGGNVGYPYFNSPFEVADTLAEIGFDIVNIATNHMLDVGYDYVVNSTGEGIAISRSTLEKSGLTVIGGYLNEDDFKSIRIVERDGIKIAFLAFTESTNTLTLFGDSEIFIPYLTEDNVKTSVALAKEIADVIIVSAHWGVDSSSKLSESQLHFAQLFADLGVDAVIGHHSHIIHPIEWVEGKDGNKMLCAYSLGNFIGIMEFPLTVLGGIMTFDIRVADGEKPVIENVGFVPTVYNYNGNYRNNRIYYLEDYTDEMVKQHGVFTRYGHDFSVAELYSHVNKTVNSDFIRSKNDYQ